MERHKEISLLFLLLALAHVCTFDEECPCLPHNVSCYNDYDHIITCVWNSTHVPNHADTVCTIDAERLKDKYGYRNSCRLEPFDVSRPMLKKCSVIFARRWNFQSKCELTINLNCNAVKQLSFSYKPAHHIKLNPPPKPEINFTTVSWFVQVAHHNRVSEYNSELQWKQVDQPWRQTLYPPVYKGCKWACTAKLDPDKLTQGERYEARTRVKRVRGPKYCSTWSDWSPTASWVSPIGRVKPPPPTPPPGVAGSVLGTFACAVVFALLLIFVRTNKTTWFYIVKRIRGPPLPNPSKSFLRDVNFQNWLSPYLTSESFTSFLKPVEIISVEVTSTVDAVAPSGPEEKMRSKSSCESTSSNFSNPSYSHLSAIPVPVSSLTAGNLEACGADTPYGPVCCQGEGKNAEQDRAEISGKEVEILHLLSKGRNSSEPMLVISDYEKAEKPQVERSRLQSLDSGVCSGEEVSQESLEADSINVSDCHDEGPEGKQESDRENGKEVDFRKLFASSGDILGSIQVCSGYEQVQKLQADSSELLSLDSGISSGGEEHPSQEESLEDVDKSTESTSLLFSPPPASSSVLACSFPSLTPLPFNFSGAGLSPAALMSTNRPVEPSGDGYMPVRQEHS